MVETLYLMQMQVKYELDGKFSHIELGTKTIGNIDWDEENKNDELIHINGWSYRKEDILSRDIVVIGLHAYKYTTNPLDIMEFQNEAIDELMKILKERKDKLEAIEVILSGWKEEWEKAKNEEAHNDG